MTNRSLVAFATVLAIGGSGVPARGADAQPAAQGVEPVATNQLTNELGSLEEHSYTAWKAGETKFWTTFLSDKFVTWGAGGRTDKRNAIVGFSDKSCQIASFKLTNTQVTPLTPDAALLTHRTEVSGACNGTSMVPNAYTVSLYVREAGHWKLGFRTQSAIVDPMKATRPAGSDQWSSGPTRTDADTQAMLAREQVMVDAWKDHDAARMDKFFGPSLQFVDIFGNHIGSRAAALKAWSGEGCDVKGFKFSGAKATLFAPDFGVLTYRAIYDAKCFGQDVWPIWGTSFYVKHGDTWLWSSGINILAGAVAN